MPEEIKVDVIQKTQKILGKYVKKPQLTEKLLKKPPFRFLHDIINVVVKETGFLKGLFSDGELNSDNVKERDAKIAFLTKLIEAVKTITNTELTVKPSKIVAGLEPTETNILLQTIGRAIDKKVDSSQYVKQLKSGEINDKKKSKKVEKEKKVEKPAKTTKKDDKNKPVKVKKTNETPQSSDRNKSKTKTTTEAKIKEDAPQNPVTIEENKTQIEAPEDEKVLNDPPPNVEETKPPTPEQPTEIQETAIENPDVEIRKRSASATRPKSARPKSGDLTKNVPQEQSEVPVVEAIKPEETVQIEKSTQNRPKSSLRPPSVRPSSARPGAPRLRPDSALPIKEVVTLGKINVIVENFDKDNDDDEETTVVVQNTPEIDEKSYENLQVPDDNKGHLVEQILEQIEGENDKGNVDKSWQQEVGQVRDISKETGNLRALIQNLTKTANPLGKLLNYLHEDVDAMQSELELWTNTKKQLYSEIAKQKKISAELNKPLLTKLSTLNEEIKKIETEIVSTRSNILKNDLRIKELLTK